MWTSEEIVVTTTSITAVNPSMRSIHSECRSPNVMNVNSGTRASCRAKPTSNSAYHDNTQEMTRNVDVVSSARSDPAADGACSGSSAPVLANAACSACGDGAPRG